MKKCPYCAEEIQDDAIKCKHCGEFLKAKPQEDDAFPAPSPFSSTGLAPLRCPSCNKGYDETWKVCYSCNTPLVPSTQLKSEDVYKIGGKGKYSCPKCSSEYTNCERAIGCAVMIIIFVSLGLGAIMIPFLPYDCACRKCGHKWKT